MVDASRDATTATSGGGTFRALLDWLQESPWECKAGLFLLIPGLLLLVSGAVGALVVPGLGGGSISPERAVPLMGIGTLLTVVAIGIVVYSCGKHIAPPPPIDPPGNPPRINTLPVGQAIQVTWPHNGLRFFVDKLRFPHGTRMTVKRWFGQKTLRQPWVIVSLEPTNQHAHALYYPQAPVEILDDGSVVNGMPAITIGYPGDEGKTFGIHLVVADRWANAFFRKTIQEWEEENDYAGLRWEKLPPTLDWILKSNVVRV